MATVIICRFFLLFIVSLLTSASTTTCNTSSSAAGGLSIPLIHRYSRHFPYYDRNTTRADVWKALALQSTLRQTHHMAVLRGAATAEEGGGVRLPIVYDFGIYVTTVSIGSPPVDVMMYVDTGSMLIWTQCAPCTQCHRHTGTNIYDPNLSLTGFDEECFTTSCQAMAERGAVCKDSLCAYKVQYGNGDKSTGHLVNDNFVLLGDDGKNRTIREVVFGCADDSAFHFPHGVTGFLGLSAGPLSVINQIFPEVDGYAFSYCLVPYAYDSVPPSNLLIGKGALLLGNSTPMTTTGSAYYFYYLLLEDISVGPDRLKLPPGVFKRSSNPKSGFIIDSGTALTLLKRDVFEMVVKKMEASVMLPRTNEAGDAWRLCYHGGSSWNMRDNSTSIPTMTFHFAGGLDVVLKPRNTFVEVAHDVLCLAMRGVDGVSIWGNLAHQNLNLGHDVLNELLYVLPKDCASA